MTTISSLSPFLTHLHSLLEQYKPIDRREKVHRQRMLALATEVPHPTSRSSFSPGHFTASAFILSPSRDELLLIYHSKLERWLQPGGHIDAMDGSIIEAASREIQEEVNISDLLPSPPTIFDLDIHHIPARAHDPTHEHFDVRFLFQAPSRHCIAGSDAKEAQWYSLEKIHEIESDQSVMRAVDKLLAMG